MSSHSPDEVVEEQPVDDTVSDHGDNWLLGSSITQEPAYDLLSDYQLSINEGPESPLVEVEWNDDFVPISDKPGTVVFSKLKALMGTFHLSQWTQDVINFPFHHSVPKLDRLFTVSVTHAIDFEELKPLYLLLHCLLVLVPVYLITKSQFILAIKLLY